MIGLQAVLSDALLGIAVLVLLDCITAVPEQPFVDRSILASAATSCVVDQDAAIAADKNAQPTGEPAAELVSALAAA